MIPWKCTHVMRHANRSFHHVLAWNRSGNHSGPVHPEERPGESGVRRVVWISADGTCSVRDVLLTYWDDNRRHSRWEKMTESFRYRIYPTVQRFGMKCLNKPCTFLRQELIPNHEWSQCEERSIRNELLQDELILSSQPWQGPISHVFSINRAANDVPFTLADRNLVRLVHEELGMLFELKLQMTTANETIPSDLSPRLQTVLICLLSGEGEKQIAARTGLSSHTVHDHVRSLYRKFDVRSRSELFAYAHRRGWGPGKAPDPPN